MFGHVKLDNNLLYANVLWKTEMSNFIGVIKWRIIFTKLCHP